MQYTLSSWERSWDCWPFFLWRISTPDGCYKCSTAERDQSSKFLNCVEDNLRTQLLSEPAGEDMDSLFMNRKGLVDDMMIRGHLGQSSHWMREFLILRELRTEASRTSSSDFYRADFGPFRSLVDRVAWKPVLKGKGVREGKKELFKCRSRLSPCAKWWAIRKTGWAAQSFGDN